MAPHPPAFAAHRLGRKMIEFWTTADNIPAVPGAYVLVIKLCEPVVARICGKPSAPLAAGEYLYCGSARGSDGLRGRLARHMRHGKSIHWHIDTLTESGTVLGAGRFRASVARTVESLSKNSADL